jgi:carbonic anhydrase
MDAYETLVERNAGFAAHDFTAGLRISPVLRAIVIGCVDPRVDPTAVLGTELGEVAAIRNVGGRVTPAVRRELAMLRKVGQAAGGGPVQELIVLHHTDCGITRIQDQTAMLATFFEIEPERLGEWHIGDPRAAVALDVAALRADPEVPGTKISGLVYDVTTGRIETVVKP